MGHKIVGVTEVHEISLTRKGANQHAKVILRKSLGAPPTTTTEDPDMEMKITKALLGLNEAGRTYALGLEDDKLKAFLEQSDEDRATEVQKHVDAEIKAKADKDAADKLKAAGDPEVVALRAEVDTLKSAALAEKEKTAIAEIEKTAAREYPDVPTAVDTLKSIRDLGEDARKPVLATLKSMQDMAKQFGVVHGDDTAIDGDATTAYRAKVAEVSKAKSITPEQAELEIAQDPASAALVANMLAEQAG